MIFVMWMTEKMPLLCFGLIRRKRKHESLVVYVFHLFSLSWNIDYGSSSQLVSLHKLGFTLDVDWQVNTV